MKKLDRILQNWRIAKARPYIPQGARVLDIGCADATLFRRVPGIGSYVGVDHHLVTEAFSPNMVLLKGSFPDVPRDEKNFDSITLLACLEHIPTKEQQPTALRCFELLKVGGRLIISVPDPKVDTILDGLAALRLIDGMELDEHYHFDVRSTPQIFESVGFSLEKHQSFQLGLNNLFVFLKTHD